MVKIAALSLGALLVIAAAARAADPPNLTGTWKRNAELSDDAKEKLRSSRGGGGGGGFGRGGGRGGFGGGGRRGGGGGGRGSSSEEGDRQPRTMPDLVADTLRIAQEPGRVTISVAGRPDRALTADGQKRTLEEADGIGAEVTAQWKKDKLVVVTQRDTGRKRTDVYELVADGLRVIDTITVEGGDPPMKAVTFKEVYDRFDAASPTPPPTPEAPQRSQETTNVQVSSP
jgi:hypothetical protein